VPGLSDAHDVGLLTDDEIGRIRDLGSIEP